MFIVNKIFCFRFTLTLTLTVSLIFFSPSLGSATPQNTDITISDNGLPMPVNLECKKEEEDFATIDNT